MKLLLLLFPVCASAFFIPDLFGNGNSEKDKELLGLRSGQLTEESKAKLAKLWGIDLNARKARLARISKKAGDNLKKSLKTKSELKESLKAILPVKMSKLNGKKASSILEANSRKELAEYLFHGDIHLSERQLTVLENERGSSRQKRMAWAFANKWANNTLNFMFDDSILDAQRATIREALANVQEQTCVNFVEDANAVNKVLVYRDDDDCYSSLGIEGGTQLLSLGNGCEAAGTATHEFMHALGFDHTQSRSDRNTYVDVDISVVNPQSYADFEQYRVDENILYVPYEYGSIMHYAANRFVNTPGKLSMVPKDGNYTYTMGNLLISFYDILMINDHYNCIDKCPVATSAVCQNGGYPNPRNCAVCNCPRGYGGAFCDKQPVGCARTLIATHQWQKFQISLGDENDDSTKDVFTTCNDWITAPQGKQIQVRITGMENEYCNYGCLLNGIEFKVNANLNVTNPIYCCWEFNNRIITSDLNPTPVISFNRFWIVKFEIEYRFVDGSNTFSTTTPGTTTEKTTTTTTDVKTTQTPTQKPSTGAPTTTTTDARTSTTAQKPTSLAPKTTITGVKTTETPTQKPTTGAPTTTTTDAKATQTPTQKPSSGAPETTTTDVRTTETLSPKQTTAAPANPGCINPMTFSLVALEQMVNNNIDKHRYHSNSFFLQNWATEGYIADGQIGSVIDPMAYETNKAVFDALCPSLVKLRTFIFDSEFQYLTTDDTEAQNMISAGWPEAVPVGYCSPTKACGANKNLRSVHSADQGDMIYSTDDAELNNLNNSPRYQGGLTDTICWLF